MDNFWVRRVGVVLAVLVLATAVGLAVVTGLNAVRENAKDNRFVEGFHDPLTGERFMVIDPETGEEEYDIEGMINSVSERGQAAFIVFFHTKCPHCHTYIDDVQEAWEAIEADDYMRGRVTVIAINVGQETDKTVKDFIKQHGLTFLVIAGADEKFNQPTPATYLFARPTGTGPWVYIGKQVGVIDAQSQIVDEGRRGLEYFDVLYGPMPNDPVAPERQH